MIKAGVEQIGVSKGIELIKEFYNKNINGLEI
jgi:hypothetical protein